MFSLDFAGTELRAHVRAVGVERVHCATASKEHDFTLGDFGRENPLLAELRGGSNQVPGREVV